MVGIREAGEAGDNAIFWPVDTRFPRLYLLLFM